MATTTYTIRGVHDATAIDKAKQGLLGLGDGIGKLNTLFKGFVGAKIIQELGDFAFESIKEFGEMERKMIQLKTAVGGNVQAFTDMTDVIAEAGKKTLESKDNVESLVSKIASLGKSDSDIKRLTDASVALSNTTGVSLDAAFTQINATFSGTAGRLSKLVPEIGNLTKSQLLAGGAVDLLNAKLGAISDSMANGVSQKLKNLSDNFGDLRQNIGEKMVIAFSPMLKFIDGIINKWNSAFDAQKRYKDALEADDPVLAAAIKKVTELQNSYDKSKAIHDLSVHQGLIDDSQGRGNMDAIRDELLRARRSLDALQKARAPATGGESLSSSSVVINKEEEDAWAKFIDSNRVGWRDVSTGIEDYASALWDNAQSFTDSAISLMDNMIPGAGSSDSGIAAYKPTLGEQAGGIIEGQKGNASASIAPMFDIIGQLSNSFGPLLEIFTKLSPLINWGTTIISGMMDVLGPLIDSLIKPLVGILKIVGQTIGKLLAPALQLLEPIITLIAKLFVFLFNNVIVPVHNAIQRVFNLILNGFIAFANGILAIIDAIPFVNVGRISYVAANAGFLDTISLDDVNAAGAAGTSSSGAASSSSYTGAKDVTVNIYYTNSYVNGDAREIALNIRNEIKLAEGVGL